MKYRLITIFIICLVQFHAGESQVPDSVEFELDDSHSVDTMLADHIFYEDKIKAPNQALSPPAFSDRFQEKYNERAFNYTNQRHPWAIKFFRWIDALLEKIFGRETGSSSSNMLFKILLVFILLIAVLSIIRLFLGKDSLSLFFKRKNAGLKLLPDHEMDFSEDELTQKIKNSVEDGDYRSALRYHYLLLLKKLHLNGIIEFHPEKTDSEYLRELKDVDLKQRMQYIIYIYHRTWYGRYAIDLESYTSADQSFNRIHQKLNHG